MKFGPDSGGQKVSKSAKKRCSQTKTCNFIARGERPRESERYKIQKKNPACYLNRSCSLIDIWENVSTKIPTKRIDNFCPRILKSGEINKVKIFQKKFWKKNLSQKNHFFLGHFANKIVFDRKLHSRGPKRIFFSNFFFKILNFWPNGPKLGQICQKFKILKKKFEDSEFVNLVFRWREQDKNPWIKIFQNLVLPKSWL